MSVRTSKVLERFGDWVVTTYGIECTASYYHIEKSRVWEEYGGHGADSWVDHMSAKTWVNIGDFTKALHAAQERWPRKDVNP